MTAVSIKQANTFGLDVTAAKLLAIDSVEALVNAWQTAEQHAQPTLILGEGSNVLFVEDFAGVVILNRIKGIAVTETDSHWRLHVGAGENWHALVTYTIENNMPGMENLALIPGCTGSAPIQNIGAYGVEFERFCDYVDVVNLNNGQVTRLTDLQFGYRDSIFKHHYRDGYAIVAVGLRLAKNWQPVLTYGDLKNCDPKTVTPKMVYDAVCQIRRDKLPDPKQLGNAGSFFKNPVVSASQAQALLRDFPNAPHYPQADGSVKLAAGWLIDQCGLKGFQIGGAAVHQNQALVLVNKGTALACDVVALAAHVNRSVMAKFGVLLEPEVRFMGATGERDALVVLSETS